MCYLLKENVGGDFSGWIRYLKKITKFAIFNRQTITLGSPNFGLTNGEHHSTVSYENAKSSKNMYVAVVYHGGLFFDENV